jgi:hypothetical protein
MELQQPYLIKASDGAERDYQARNPSYFRRIPIFKFADPFISASYLDKLE